MLAQLLEQTDINNSEATQTMIKCFGEGNGEANSDGGDWGTIMEGVGFLIDRKV